MKKYVELLKQLPEFLWVFVREHLGNLSANTLGWITIVLLHFASVPTLLAVLLGASDRLPPVDLMIFVWSALITLFFKALIDRNALYVATICMGFAAQTLIMGLILFK